ncbi:MAG: AfsR/SARP family transcriptional regulator [Intrasporangium sp.]|uniref:AfsR/SARP family transcriptional regulator n=1 Tax=Intrasporangium sp. TaxID=1925024 RepID=UPI0026470745|nr:AfsR/SARP family transcriptional regulator [Intrasporangium sp.]MDN5794437.1 AfsR/SARP family transcriptional regulator [Intrasporangium sp.]
MQINLLGPMVVLGKTGPCYLRSRQVGALLAVLALSSGETRSPAALEQEFWPDQELKNTRNALHATVSRLRRFLAEVGTKGEGVTLHSSGGRYRLDVPPGCVDALTFRSLVRQAETTLPSHPLQSLEYFEAGLALWSGPALDDVASCTELRAEKVRLDELRLTALEGVAEARLRLGHTRRVVGDLRHLVEIHGDRERLTELLMLALYRSGQQTEALDAFDRLRSRLNTEFGMYPSRSLRTIQQAILEQDRTLDLAVAFGQATVSATRQ